MSQSVWFQSTLRTRHDVAPVIEKINQIATRSIWADDEDVDVSSATVRHAANVVDAVAKEFYIEGLIWKAPSVKVSPNGSIHLSWKFDDNKISLNVIGDGHQATCIEKYLGISPNMNIMTDFDSAMAVAAVARRVADSIN